MSPVRAIGSWRAAVGMPKKFQGENSKAVTARARKAEAQAVADACKKQQEEDALWEETDKHVLKKEQRKVGKASFFSYGAVHTSGFGFKICGFLIFVRADQADWTHVRDIHFTVSVIC